MPLDPATLESVRHVLQLARLAIFGGYIGLGIRVMKASGLARRSAINQLLLYTLAVHVAIAIPQKDAWPFSMYTLMTTNALDRTSLHSAISFRCVDIEGREWQVDPLAWSPLYPQSIMGWFVAGFPLSSSDERNEVARFLLQRAEVARIHAINGDHFYGNQAVLGTVAAPDTHLYARAPQSSVRLRGIRVYRVWWNPTDLATGRPIVRRDIIWEYLD